MPKIKVGLTRKRFSRKEFNRIARCQIYNKDMEFVKTAYDLAEYGHKGVKRMDGTNYFEHVKAVALIIMLECDVYLRDPIVIGLMHDLREDEHILSWWAIEEFFGKSIYRGLRIMTKEEGKDYYQQLASVAKRDWWIILVKLVDILHNLRSMPNTTKVFKRKQLEEKCRVYPILLAELAKRIPRDRMEMISYLERELEQATSVVAQSLTPKTSKVEPKSMNA